MRWGTWLMRSVTVCRSLSVQAHPDNADGTATPKWIDAIDEFTLPGGLGAGARSSPG
jgi:hypothetical protein